MHIRWGILGTGRMAETIAAELATLREAGLELRAVASRRASKAQDFAARHGIPRHWGSYAELAADPEADVVYVASPDLRCRRRTIATEAPKSCRLY